MDALTAAVGTVLGGKRTSLVALGVYVAISFLYFGLPVASHPGRYVIGAGVDPEIFIWSFAWWPHAILDGLDPFVTHVIWAPDGVNLAWTTSVPGLALAFSPLTLLAGPVVAYNVAAVLLPALAAWTAFLLCRRVTGKVLPSLVGGYLFGFSSYMLGQQEGHPHMTAVFLLPLVALVVLRYLEGELDGQGLALRLGALIAVQLSFSTELAFTMTLALVAALAIGFAVDRARRPRMLALARPLVGAYVLATVLASPLLYYALTGFESGSINAPKNFPADLLNFVLPTGLVAVSHNWGMTGVVSQFLGNDAEDGAYLGVPMLAIVALYCRHRWRSPSGRFLACSLALAFFAALGTALHVGGDRIVALPWALIAQLPLFNNVLPVRFALYISLVVAVMAAGWLASRGRLWPRLLLAGLAVASIFPHFGTVPYLGHGYWKVKPDRPAFFTEGLYRQCLRPNENILVFPFSARGDSMLWQAEADFYYRMAEGYISPEVPRSFTVYPGFGQMRDGLVMGAADLWRLAAAKGITTILIRADNGTPELAAWNAFLPTIARGRAVGGVVLYPLAPGVSTRAGCAD